MGVFWDGGYKAPSWGGKMCGVGQQGGLGRLEPVGLQGLAIVSSCC